MHYHTTTPLPPCPNGLTSDGQGGCIPTNISTFCGLGYLSDGNGNCILIPPPV